MRKIWVLLSALMLSASPALASTVAYIYSNINNNQNGANGGTNVYSTTGDGKVTLLKGSPFPTIGAMVGTNGKFFITQGGGYLFSYKIESNGGIGATIESQINTQHYSGGGNSGCGITDPLLTDQAELDHTGEYVYINLNSENDCEATQTYKISSKGTLTFEGVYVAVLANLSGIPEVTGNNKFAFAFGYNELGNGVLVPFSRSSSDGVLTYDHSAVETDPTAPPSAGGILIDSQPTPDPTDHYAVVVTGYLTGPPRLASYTVESQGDITSTNTWKDMPIVPNFVYTIELDPTGKYLAVATGTGVEIFHFNGSKPITPFTKVIGSTGYVNSIAWDKSGHLYAVNGASGKLHTYSVNSKGITEEKDSPTAAGLFLTTGNIVVRPE